MEFDLSRSIFDSSNERTSEIKKSMRKKCDQGSSLCFLHLKKHKNLLFPKNISDQGSHLLGNWEFCNVSIFSNHLLNKWKMSFFTCTMKRNRSIPLLCFNIGTFFNKNRNNWKMTIPASPMKRNSYSCL